MKTIGKVLIALIVIAGIVVAGKKVIKEKQAKEAKLPKPVIYAMNVKTMTPKISHTTLTLPYLALTKSDDNVKISSRLSGRIEYIVKNGKAVKKGEIIAKIDDKDLRVKIQALKLNINSLKSELNSKRVALANLEATHQRTLRLLAVKGASQEQADREETQIAALKAGINTLKFKVDELKANINAIQNNLSYATIKAPVNGVASRLANIGDVAMPGKPLVSISAKSNSYLLVRLPDNVKSNEIIFHNKHYPLSPLNTTFNGLLEYIANIDESLASNQLVNIDVVVFNGNGYKLPHDAILDRNGKHFVLVYNNHQATPKEVKIIANGEQGVVVEGLNSNDKIVVAKQDILLKLLTGVKVNAVK